MCSAAAAVAMIEHQQAMRLKLLASYFYPAPALSLPSPTMTTNNHRLFQMVLFVLDPVDNFDTVDMDYSIVGSEGKHTKNNELFLNDSFLCTVCGRRRLIMHYFNIYFINSPYYFTIFIECASYYTAKQNPRSPRQRIEIRFHHYG